MARLIGTGRDPNGQYGKGVLFDVPRIDPHYAELIDKGYAERVGPHDDPARGTVDIANSVVRGDALLHPAEQDIADYIGNRAHDIVATQDPDAPLGAGSPDPDVTRQRQADAVAAANPDDAAYERGSSGHTASGATVEQGDIATHTGLPASDGGVAADDGEAATAEDDGVLSADSNVAALEAEYNRQVDAGDIEPIEEGSGNGGRLVKGDYVKALGLDES